jgi:hypothetical protein
MSQFEFRKRAYPEQHVPMNIRSDRKSKIWSVVRVSSGNFLEMYDFMVFGYYASAIGKAFFSSGSEKVPCMRRTSESCNHREGYALEIAWSS